MSICGWCILFITFISTSPSSIIVPKFKFLTLIQIKFGPEKKWVWSPSRASASSIYLKLSWVQAAVKLISEIFSSMDTKDLQHKNVIALDNPNTSEDHHQNSKGNLGIFLSDPSAAFFDQENSTKENLCKSFELRETRISLPPSQEAEANDGLLSGNTGR